jgi:short-subunit dehydrogenase
MTKEDFENEMNIHYWAAFNLVQNLYPRMKKQGAGHIINISSIGGRVAVPHLLPYSASKFALGGLSEGLNTELSRHNIKVTTVYPGLMRTGSIYQAQFKGQPKLEKTWFSLVASLPFISMGADRAARKILQGSAQGKSVIVLSAPAKIAVWTHALLPNAWAFLNRALNRLLPNKVETTEARRGIETDDLLPEVVKTLSNRAAKENNELIQ